MTGKLPAAGWYVLAGTLALAGLAVAVGLVLRLIFGFPDPVRFLAPGAAAFEVAEPGRYVLWHEHQTIFAGRSYDSPPELPAGIQFRLEDASGRAVSIRPGGGASWEVGATKRVTVAEFAARDTGRYSIAADGSFEPRVLSVGPSMLKPLFVTAAGAIASLIIGLSAGVAVGLYAFLRQASAAAALEAAGATPEADQRERRLRQLAALVYALQASALVVGVTLFAGVIVNYVKREEAAGTWLESHFRWQIRTFWWSMLWTVLGLATAIVAIGLVIMLVSAVWFVYRIAKGWSGLNDGRPMYAD